VVEGARLESVSLSYRLSHDCPGDAPKPRLHNRHEPTRAIRGLLTLLDVLRKPKMVESRNSLGKTARAAPQVSLSRPVAYLCSRLAINV
jgi:hypothetical protein